MHFCGGAIIPRRTARPHSAAASRFRPKAVTVTTHAPFEPPRLHPPVASDPSPRVHSGHKPRPASTRTVPRPPVAQRAAPRCNAAHSRRNDDLRAVPPTRLTAAVGRTGAPVIRLDSRTPRVPRTRRAVMEALAARPARTKGGTTRPAASLVPRIALDAMSFSGGTP
jgi:hypothetical protein